MKGSAPLPVLLVALVLFAGGCDGPPRDATAPDPARSSLDPASTVSAAMAGTDGAGLATVRQATARYHRFEVAVDEGWVAPDPECVAEEGVGAMGIHYIHMGNLNDGMVDPAKPDVLLYEPQKNGRMRLVGAEFVVWRADWGDPPGPTFLGREFDQSFGEHSHGLPDHYELHLWIWRHNPAGLMTPFNPNVSCP